MTFHFASREDVSDLFDQAGRRTELAALASWINSFLCDPEDRVAVLMRYTTALAARNTLIQEKSEQLASFTPAKESPDVLPQGS